MDLSVIVVHYRTPHLLRALVHSLFVGHPQYAFEVLVLDNGDGESLLDQVPDDSRVSLHALGTNVGFAKAANEGMRKANGTYFLVANGDVEFPASMRRSSGYDLSCEAEPLMPRQSRVQ